MGGCEATEKKAQVNCFNCDTELEVFFTKNDLIASGKNVKCHKCNGVLWIQIDVTLAKGNVSAQFPGILLSGKMPKKEKTATTSGITVEVSSKEYPEDIALTNVKEYLEQLKKEIGEAFKLPDDWSVSEQKNDKPVY
jgi:hypothetical protein